MTTLDEHLARLDDLPVPDQWDDIARRSERLSGPEIGRPAVRRRYVAAVAAVAVLVGALAVMLLRPDGGTPVVAVSRPADRAPLLDVDQPVMPDDVRQVTLVVPSERLDEPRASWLLGVRTDTGGLRDLVAVSEFGADAQFCCTSAAYVIEVDTPVPGATTATLEASRYVDVPIDGGRLLLHAHGRGAATSIRELIDAWTGVSSVGDVVGSWEVVAPLAVTNGHENAALTTSVEGVSVTLWSVPSSVGWSAIEMLFFSADELRPVDVNGARGWQTVVGEPMVAWAVPGGGTAGLTADLPAGELLELARRVVEIGPAEWAARGGENLTSDRAGPPTTAAVAATRPPTQVALLDIDRPVQPDDVRSLRPVTLEGPGVGVQVLGAQLYAVVGSAGEVSELISVSEVDSGDLWWVDAPVDIERDVPLPGAQLATAVGGPEADIEWTVDGRRFVASARGPNARNELIDFVTAFRPGAAEVDRWNFTSELPGAPERGERLSVLTTVDGAVVEMTAASASIAGSPIAELFSIEDEPFVPIQIGSIVGWRSSSELPTISFDAPGGGTVTLRGELSLDELLAVAEGLVELTPEQWAERAGRSSEPPPNATTAPATTAPALADATASAVLAAVENAWVESGLPSFGADAQYGLAVIDTATGDLLLGYNHVKFAGRTGTAVHIVHAATAVEAGWNDGRLIDGTGPCTTSTGDYNNLGGGEGRVDGLDAQVLMSSRCAMARVADELDVTGLLARAGFQGFTADLIDSPPQLNPATLGDLVRTLAGTGQRRLEDGRQLVTISSEAATAVRAFYEANARIGSGTGAYRPDLANAVVTGTVEDLSAGWAVSVTDEHVVAVGVLDRDPENQTGVRLVGGGVPSQLVHAALDSLVPPG